MVGSGLPSTLQLSVAGSFFLTTRSVGCSMMRGDWYWPARRSREIGIRTHAHDEDRGKSGWARSLPLTAGSATRRPRSSGRSSILLPRLLGQGLIVVVVLVVLQAMAMLWRSVCIGRGALAVVTLQLIIQMVQWSGDHCSVWWILRLNDGWWQWVSEMSWAAVRIMARRGRVSLSIFIILFFGFQGVYVWCYVLFICPKNSKLFLDCSTYAACISMR